MEDEALLARELEFTLNSLGYDVFGSVSSGEDAVKIVETDRPDLILMDIKLKGEIDGIEAAEQIRDRLDVPIVYLSAYSETDVLDRAARTEPYGYLSKPVSYPELRNVIETALVKFDADRRVRTSEERFRFAMEASSDGIWDWDVRTGAVYYSPAYFSMLGVEPGAYPDDVTSWLDLLHPDDRECACRVNEHCVNGERASFEAEFRMRHTDGSWRTILSRGKAVARDRDGRAIRLVGTHTDVTERKKAEEALRESDVRYRRAVELSPNPIMTLAADGTILSWNHACEKLTGCPRDEAQGRRLSESALVPAHTDRFSEIVSRVFQGHTFGGVRLDFRAADGSVRNMMSRAFPLTDSRGEVVECMLANTDITEIIRAEEALRETEERFRLAMEAVNDGLWDWNLITGDVYRSPAFFTMLGYTEDEFPAPLEGWRSLIHEDDRDFVPAALDACLRGESPEYAIEFRMTHKSGRQVWILSRGKVIEWDEHGRPKRMIGAQTDITTLRQAE